MEHRAIGRRVTTPSRPRRETLRKCDDRFMDYGKQMLLAARYSSSYIDSSSRERRGRFLPSTLSYMGRGVLFAISV